MHERTTEPLLPLPPQPDGVPWATDQWPTARLDDNPELDSLLTEAFDPSHPTGETQAIAIVHRGRLVYERYAGELVFFDRPPEPIDHETGLLSWSMAKSMLHATVGVLVNEGRLRPDEPAGLPWWGEPPADPRGAITLQQMLEMRDGLDFNEAYTEEDGHSDVIDMLFGAGQEDVAAYAAQRKLAATPGERFAYSSGTTNLVSAAVARLVGSGDRYREFLTSRLFGPIGMRSAKPGFDAAGTWVASSYVHATARDFARFGYLYLRDGIWDGVRVLPEGWVDHARLVRSRAEDGDLYGAHWWIEDDAWGTFWASGYEGQSITITPALDLVVVRLGKTPEALSPQLDTWRRAMVASFAP